MGDIKSVDLDKVIYDELEFEIDREVKDYLINVKEDTLIYRLQDEVEKILFKIEEVKLLYSNGGKWSGPNLGRSLFDQYILLYAHVNHNFIIYNVFTRYKALAEKFFRGMLTAYQIPGLYNISFNNFVLTEALLHVSPSSLQNILEKTDELKTEEGCVTKLLEKLNNFTTSTFTDGFLGHLLENPLVTEQLTNYRFGNKFTDIFANLFTILSRLNISKEQFRGCVSPLIKFLKIEKTVSWSDLEKFSDFICKKGNLFEEKELLEILTVGINGHKYGYAKYPNLIETIADALAKFYPQYKIINSKLIETAILNSQANTGKNADYKPLVVLSNVCDQSCKQTLFTAFEKYLDAEFKPDFYELLIRESNYDYNLKNYFQKYSDATNTRKGAGYKYGKLKLTDLRFINYALVLYKLKIDFSRNEVKSLTNLNDFESWLLNPLVFDYGKFNAKWLVDAKNPIFLDRLKENENIKAKLDSYLKEEFDPVLAEIKYKYFQ